MPSLLSALGAKLHRKVLNLALRIVERHVARQPGLFVFTYDREADTLVPITWKARGVTRVAAADGHRRPTNDFARLETVAPWAGKIVVDVGANLGGTVARFARTAAKVHALEPHPGNFAHLLDQIRIRRLDNVEPLRLAASKETGRATFYERESHGIHSLGPHNKGKVRTSYEVEVTTLDRLWDERINDRIGLLKVDVEGFEADVFEGAARLLDNRMIDVIVFEFSPRIHAIRGLPADAPLRVLRAHGYEVFTLDGRPVGAADDLGLCDLIARPAGGQ
jgi:FkbM family methyltransferase